MSNTEIPDDFKNITASISIKALKNNLEYLRKKSGTDVMVCLKNNAYGHGIIQISKLCRNFGVKYIGVATLGEAMQIRNSGDKGRILGWLYDINSDQVKIAAKNNIDISIFDHKHIDIISNSLPVDTITNIHLFVDTGINRNGVIYEKAIESAIKIKKDPKFKLVGIMSHLCCSKIKNDSFTMKQFQLFRKLKQDLCDVNIYPELYHISSTNGVLNYDTGDFNLVRCGRGFYGLDGSQNENLTPALCLSSKIVQLKCIPKGSGVGYDRTYISQNKEYIGIISIGYGDVLPRVNNEKMQVVVNGTKRKVLGLESMDQIVIQAKKGDKLGDEVRFFGDTKKGFIDPIYFSKQTGTTLLNILSHMGRRIKYEYVD